LYTLIFKFIIFLVDIHHLFSRGIKLIVIKNVCILNCIGYLELLIYTILLRAVGGNCLSICQKPF
jgi:hypothetical protein